MKRNLSGNVVERTGMVLPAWKSKYILINAQEDVTVNGVSIHIGEETEK